MSRSRPLPVSFYRRPAEVVARDLLGRWLVHEVEGERLAVRLVETEAYLGAPDRASHAWDGRRTARNESLYLAGGHAYVYFIYGMHWCMNAVTGEAGVGSAVLLRAGAPVAGEGRMAANRGLDRKLRPGDLAGGPGKLCRALGIDRALDGVRLDRRPLWIEAGEAAAWPLRFSVLGDPHVSRPRPVPAPGAP